MKKTAFILPLIFSFTFAKAQQEKPLQIDPQPFADNSGHWYGIADPKNMINALPGKPRYKPADVIQVADNILLFQKANG